MTSWDREDFLQRLRKDGPEETRRYYLQRIQSSSIIPEELSKCELLDLASVGKDISRNLRAAKRSPYYPDCTGIYVQVNPTTHWGVNIGLLSAVPDKESITQDKLYFKQVKTFPCKGSDDAAALYFHCQNTPYETAVVDYIWVCTLIQIRKAAHDLELPVYAGIARTDVWIELISAQNT